MTDLETIQFDDYLAQRRATAMFSCTGFDAGSSFYPDQASDLLQRGWSLLLLLDEDMEYGLGGLLDAVPEIDERPDKVVWIREPHWDHSDAIISFGLCFETLGIRYWPKVVYPVQDVRYVLPDCLYRYDPAVDSKGVRHIHALLRDYIMRGR